VSVPPVPTLAPRPLEAVAPFPVAPGPLPEEEHVQRLRTIGQVLSDPAPAGRRRGSAWQGPHRRLEQQVHRDVVDFCAWAADLGLTRQQATARLGLAARTVRAWAAGPVADGPAIARGRAVLRAPREQRAQVLELLDSVGPGLGLPSLQAHFAAMPRAELRDLLRRYRHVWIHRHRQALHVLHWHQPGRVWAIDFADPPLPLEEGWADLLAVRDLASGQQLLWLPVAAATAAETVAALQMLFTIYGAPLVLKMDNGSPFVAAATQALLAAWQVMPLFSPPGWPAYNGAIEAGIGALKARTHAQAACHGHPEVWTDADLEAARATANELGRPRGAQGPTPAQFWSQRRPVATAERAAFRATVVRLEEEGPTAAAAPAQAASLSPAESPPAAAAPPPGAASSPPAKPDQAELPAAAVREAAVGSPRDKPSSEGRSVADAATIRREAIRCALVAHGYLTFTRRRIPLPIKKKKAAKIT
jgi:Integrase core domain